MVTLHHQVLITGGSEGIGKSLAERYLQAGCRVLVTGRSEGKLQKAAKDLPGLLTFQNDIAIPEEREQLAEHVKNVLPQLNVLINNAGVQRRISLASDNAHWSERQNEIDILLSGPIHLNHLLIPFMISDYREALIVNVTSGGAYIPQSFAPVYSACKAALHHYTMVLRHSLSQTNCKIAELIPPAVHTHLATSAAHGADLNEFADKVFKELITGDKTEIGFGATENISVEIMKKPQQQIFEQNASRFPVDIYFVA